MDEAYRLKIKIGEHEFEAEGPAHIVREQFQAFRDLILSMPAPAVAQTQNGTGTDDVPLQLPPARLDLALTDSMTDKIMAMEDRVVSLTARPQSVEDAVLLVLYGQKTLRGNDAVTGGEVIEGLTATGGLAVRRVDRLLEKLGREGDVIVIGNRRSKRYRLTNAGLTRARQLATDLLAIVA